MLDLVVRGGEVIDGTGGPRRRADVGVRDGRVVAVGAVDEPARRTIDADGRVVTPVFVDIHTHYDVQAFWDPALTPSSLHGITTVVGGNCGFTVAPLADDPESAHYVLRMLSRVEGMPLEALEAGATWDWRTTAEYLDRLDGALGINAGFMVGHSAIRRLVMGPAATERAANDAELARMDELLHEGLAVGGLGFSSSWGRAHVDMEGDPVPSRFAERSELLRLAAACKDHPGTSLEFIPADPFVFDEAQKELLTAMSVAAGSPLNWNVMRVRADLADDCRALLTAADHAAARGGKVIALTIPVPFEGRFTFRNGFALDMTPEWAEVIALSPDERLLALGRPEVRARLEATYGGFMPIDSIVIRDTFTPETEPTRGRAIVELAAEQGTTPFDALLDVVCADGLQTTFGQAVHHETTADWEVSAEMWRSGKAVIGASDAGAHLDFSSNFHYPTYVLGHAVREHGVLDLEEAVHLMSAVPARLYGLVDRGVVAEGAHADLLVLDEAVVASGPITTRFDLPGGAGRLYAEPAGIDAVIVNGGVVVDHGTVTDERPGTLLRSGRDTVDPPMT